MCVSSFREKQTSCQSCKYMERLPSNARERATAEKPCLGVTAGGRVSNEGRGIQKECKILSTGLRLQHSYLFLHSITCHVLFFRSSLAFVMHMPGCRGGIPVGMASPGTHKNSWRKQNELFKEIDCDHGIAIGPVRYPYDGADRE